MSIRCSVFSFLFFEHSRFLSSQGQSPQMSVITVSNDALWPASSFLSERSMGMCWILRMKEKHHSLQLISGSTLRTFSSDKAVPQLYGGDLWGLFCVTGSISFSCANKFLTLASSRSNLTIFRQKTTPKQRHAEIYMSQKKSSTHHLSISAFNSKKQLKCITI